MFVVGTIVRTRDINAQPDEQLVLHWPVVFENTERGFNTDAIAQKGSREEAQKLADALNAVLDPPADQV